MFAILSVINCVMESNCCNHLCNVLTSVGRSGQNKRTKSLSVNLFVCLSGVHDLPKYTIKYQTSKKGLIKERKALNTFGQSTDMQKVPFLSTGGTSTGAPVCLFVLAKIIQKKRFGDYCLHSGTFYDRVVLVYFTIMVVFHLIWKINNFESFWHFGWNHDNNM